LATGGTRGGTERMLREGIAGGYVSGSVVTVDGGISMGD